ncbi:uncharacterized protein G2W53_022105 [Senna tora]|uniref:Uncharacterized protein n=1 Tax=Senna tora TaxID=362788 RepID=A0A834TN40_9FABA|nr:uncharacterized protein G2W53_022105 [Senna tora]
MGLIIIQSELKLRWSNRKLAI